MTAALEVTCKNLGRTSSLAATGMWGCQAFTGTFQAFIIVFVWTSKNTLRETQGYWKTAPFAAFSEAFKQNLLLFMADACAVTYYHRIFCIFLVADLHQGSQQLKRAPTACSLPRDTAQDDFCCHSPANAGLQSAGLSIEIWIGLTVFTVCFSQKYAW